MNSQITKLTEGMILQFISFGDYLPLEKYKVTNTDSTTIIMLPVNEAGNNNRFAPFTIKSSALLKLIEKGTFIIIN